MTPLDSVTYLVARPGHEPDVGVDPADGVGQDRDLGHVGQVAELIDHDLGLDPEPGPAGAIRRRSVVSVAFGRPADRRVLRGATARGRHPMRRRRVARMCSAPDRMRCRSPQCRLRPGWSPTEPARRRPSAGFAAIAGDEAPPDHRGESAVDNVAAAHAFGRRRRRPLPSPSGRSRAMGSALDSTTRRGRRLARPQAAEPTSAASSRSATAGPRRWNQSKSVTISVSRVT